MEKNNEINEKDMNMWYYDSTLKVLWIIIKGEKERNTIIRIKK